MPKLILSPDILAARAERIAALPVEIQEAVQAEAEKIDNMEDDQRTKYVLGKRLASLLGEIAQAGTTVADVKADLDVSEAGKITASLK